MVKEYKQTFGSHNKLCEAKRLPDDINHCQYFKNVTYFFIFSDQNVCKGGHLCKIH